MQFKALLYTSIAVRACLIAYSEVQDRFLTVKYTDIDYNVFTDAARYVLQGESPFLRSTYRYSPLLAYLLVPNLLISSIWGKVVFVAADIIAAWQMWHIGQLRHVSQQRRFWSVVAWLYNPFTATISTRGSCDSLVTVMLLGVLQLLLQGQLLLPALLYGLAVHLRIYPIIYAPAIVLHLASKQHGQLSTSIDDQTSKPLARPLAWTSWLLAMLQQGLVFGALSGGVFLLLGLVFYQLYGQLFLQEAFLHHVSRKDPRHSFSLYYYPVYLTFMNWPAAGIVHASMAQPTAAAGAAASVSGPVGAFAARQAFVGPFGRLVQQLEQALHLLPQIDAGRLAVVPQGVLLLVFAATLYKNLPLCWLLQTMAFVSFNKVCTAQYFVWYYSLLPVVLQQVAWPMPRALKVAGCAWALAQSHWLAWGYVLEFQGYGVHLQLWWAGAVFLATNTWLMWVLMGVGT